MVFSLGGDAALAEMKKGPFDVIVSDMRMPGMGGVALLERVKTEYPRVARIVLSGQADQNNILEVLPFAHQYLSKPCNVDDLRMAIDRICGLQSLLHDDVILRLIGGLDKLPSIPQVYWDLTKAIARPNVGLGDLAKIVQTDPAMSVKVLQLVNSAYFGLARTVSTVAEAVTFLGAELLRALTLSSRIFSGDAIPAIAGFSMVRLQGDSLLRARLAKRFVVDPKRADEAFTAALILDIGTIVLAMATPAKLAEIIGLARESGRPRHRVEREQLGSTHAEIGAYLQSIWGLPIPMIEATAYHHTPSSIATAGGEVLGAIHVADALIEAASTVGPAGADRLFDRTPQSSEGLDFDFLEGASLIPRLPTWRKIAAEELARHGDRTSAQDD
jgi:HD-like signal output (HDOD) protein